MQQNEVIYYPANRPAIISFILAVLTILSFCAGWLPIPFTGFICLPMSVLLGVSALILGLVSLNQIRKSNESGSPLAWIGIVIGGFVFISMLCVLIAIIALFVFSPDTIPVPPFFENYQI
jgi:hypothetical protein